MDKNNTTSQEFNSQPFAGFKNHVSQKEENNSIKIMILCNNGSKFRLNFPTATNAGFFLLVLGLLFSPVSCNNDHTPEWCLDTRYKNDTRFANAAGTFCDQIAEGETGIEVTNVRMCGNSATGIFLDHHWQTTVWSSEEACPINITKSVVGQRRVFGYTWAKWRCNDASGSNKPSLFCENNCILGPVLVDGTCRSNDTFYMNNFGSNNTCTLTSTGGCAQVMRCSCDFKCNNETTMYFSASSFQNFGAGVDDGSNVIATENYNVPHDISLTENTTGIYCIDNVVWHKVVIPIFNNLTTVSAFIDYDGVKVIVNIVPAGTYQVLIVKLDFQVYKEFTGTYFELPIPNDVRSSNGDLKVQVFSAGSVVESRTFTVVGFTSCQLANCIFCSGFFQNFSCVPGVYQGAIIVLFVVVLFALVVSVPIVSFMIMIIVRILWRLLCMLYKVFKMMMFNRVTMSAYKKLSTDETELKENEKEEEKPVKKRLNKNVYLTFIFIFFLVDFKKVLACDNGAVIQANVENCVVSGQFETCGVSFEVDLGLPFPGAISCLTLTDAKTNNVIGSLNLTLESIQDIHPLNIAYYTSAWDPAVETHHLCYSTTATDFCPSGCDFVNANPTATYQPYDNTVIFNDPTVANGVGLARCRRVPGCAWNGCGWCQDACVTSRFAISPVGNPVSVMTIGSGVITANVRFSLDDSGNDFESYCTSGQGECKNLNFTLDIDTITADNTIVFDRKVIKSNNQFYYSTALDANTLVAGQIGELQAKTADSFAQNTFNFGTGMFTVTDNGHEDDYNVLTSALPDALTQGDQLPKLINGLLWYADSGTIKANLTAGSVTMRVVTNRPITVTRLTSLVCPKIISASASGCSQCTSGAQINIVALSECAAGSALVSTDSPNVVVSTNDVDLSTDNQNFIVNIQTSVVSNSFNLIISSGSKSDSIAVVFSAPQNVSLKNDSWIAVHGVVDAAGNGVQITQPIFDPSDFLPRTLFGMGTPLEIFVVVMIFLVGGIALIGGSIFIIRRFGTWSILMKAMKMKKDQ